MEKVIGMKISDYKDERSFRKTAYKTFDRRIRPLVALRFGVGKYYGLEVKRYSIDLKGDSLVRNVAEHGTGLTNLAVVQKLFAQRRLKKLPYSGYKYLDNFVERDEIYKSIKEINNKNLLKLVGTSARKIDVTSNREASEFVFEVSDFKGKNMIKR
jgi:hypothetical protein